VNQTVLGKRMWKSGTMKFVDENKRKNTDEHKKHRVKVITKANTNSVKRT